MRVRGGQSFGPAANWLAVAVAMFADCMGRHPAGASAPPHLHRAPCADPPPPRVDASGSDAPGSDRKAPNTQFLGRFLKGVEQGNKRVIATNAGAGRGC